MPSENQTAVEAVYASLTNPDTRRSIIAEPKKHAQEAGMDVEGKEVRVVTCTRDTVFIPIDSVPDSGELSQSQLGAVAAAGQPLAHLQGPHLSISTAPGVPPGWGIPGLE